jgi:signal transduction histidine kinase
MASVIDAAVAQENSVAPAAGESVFLALKAADGVRGTDLAKLLAFARAAGADADTVGRTLPVIAAELMRNAATYGATRYEVELRDDGTSLALSVADNGPGFDWAKVVARARCGMDKARASGLQVVLAITPELTFENGGRVVRVNVNKRSATELQ